MTTGTQPVQVEHFRKKGCRRAQEIHNRLLRWHKCNATMVVMARIRKRAVDTGAAGRARKDMSGLWKESDPKQKKK